MEECIHAKVCKRRAEIDVSKMCPLTRDCGDHMMMGPEVEPQKQKRQYKKRGRPAKAGGAEKKHRGRPRKIQEEHNSEDPNCTCETCSVPFDKVKVAYKKLKKYNKKGKLSENQVIVFEAYEHKDLRAITNVEKLQILSMLKDVEKAVGKE